MTQSIYWEPVPVTGDVFPAPRSGHSFTTLGERFILFGGNGRLGGKPQALNDLWELDMSEPEEIKWKELSIGGPAPSARARHTSVAVDDARMVVFGGLDKNKRFNDVWVFNCDEKSWTLKEIEGAAPEPRAHFTATRFGTRILIFGGYGGCGEVYNDMWVLHLDGEEGAFRWENLTEQIDGTGPPPRFDHCAFIYPIEPNSPTFDKLVIMGGRDLSQMFSDSHCLDLRPNEETGRLSWENDAQPPTLPYEICNNICNGIESVPFHKVFSFGGKKGPMQYLSTVEVMDCGSQVWSTPPVDHGVSPSGREDTAWVFDAKTCSLLIFGGWSNRWLNDLVRLNISSIIGPPYACTCIEPESGPVFGTTELLIKGLRFRGGKIQVKFGNNEKNEVVVDGEFVDSTTVMVRTPNYEVFGALAVDVRVSINGEGWTVNKVKFAYFANTAARNCIAYGPGLLETSLFGIEMPFLIQAKDTQNEKRGSGADEFTAKVVSEDGKITGLTRVVDTGTGIYEAFYTVPMTGDYLVHVTFTELGSSQQVAIRGSPFKTTIEDPWTKHRIMGSTPAKRKGATLNTVGTELVLYGGDKSGVSVCATDAGDWKWSTATVEGEPPPDRSMHTATLLSDSEIAVFGGTKLADNADLNDMYYLKKNPDGSWSWSHPALGEPYMRHPLAVDRDFYVLCGDSGGENITEFGMTDTTDRETAQFLEPILTGDIPEPCKACAVASTGNKLVMFGGQKPNEEELLLAVADLVVFEINGPNNLLATVNPPCKGAAPAARAFHTMQEYSPGKIFLYGGMDANNKPLNDAWLLDVSTMTWELVYYGSPEMVLPTGSVATLLGNKLVMLNSNAGSPKLDMASSLDFIGIRDSFNFVDKMKVESVAILERLETWIDKQTHAMDLAQNLEKLGQSFDSLLKVMDSLFQIKTKKTESDLLMEQLGECFTMLSGHKVSTAKLEKRLETALASEAERIKKDLETFASKVLNYKMESRKRTYFKYATGPDAAYPELDKTGAELTSLKKECERLYELAAIFEFAHLVDPTMMMIKESLEEVTMVKDVWDTSVLCEQQFADWKATLWNDIRTDEMEDGAKGFIKEVKGLNKKVRDEDCFRGVDDSVKNFLISVPLVADLRSPAMRDRHWEQLMTATAVSFDVNDPSFKLDDLLKLELHKFEEEVGEIVDRAQKEEKMELALEKLNETWSKVEFQFIKFKETPISTIKMAEEDFEALEDNQVLVQGMMANRYMNTFRDAILGWNKKLMNVADVNQIMSEIQRTWAYLESLFIHSEEVKKELPEATVRFATIDKEVKEVLKTFAELKNAVECCNRDGLMKFLEKQQSELEICEKALADYMESKRRAFPRFYFVSTADLLDILSNGNSPTRVMIHMSKCFQAIEKLKLDNDNPPPGTRPKALGMETCVGLEYVAFQKPLPLIAKVEDYMNDIISTMRSELRLILKDSVADYPTKARHDWIFDWPSQLILVVNQIYWCQEVEEAYAKIAQGDKGAMAKYNELQISQLTKLIEVTTRGDLKKESRQKVMNMITIDAHSRDIIAQNVEAGADKVDSFQWVAQLRSYWDTSVNDCRVRICDASFPYGYEYLGNGARLVITPLTDRIYITATQACWLCLGTAPAG
eukprot:gene23007-30199_t